MRSARRSARSARSVRRSVRSVRSAKKVRVAALQLQRRGVLTHEERRVASSLQYNRREDEWGVSTLRPAKERQYR